MLFTRCPGCETTFRVSADTLRVANGAVRCGQCATVFSAFSGLRQDALDRDMQNESEFLSPTLQTQELASIAEIESPEVSADEVASVDEDPAKAAAEEVVEEAPAEPEIAATVDADAQKPLAAATESAGNDVVPEMSDARDSIELGADVFAPDARTAATSGQLKFEAPEDEWAQVIKEIEEAETQGADAEWTAADDGPDAPAERAVDDGALAATPPEQLEPFALDAWDEPSTTNVPAGAQAAARGDTLGHAPAAAAEMLGDDDAIVVEDEHEEPITAEEIDATLSRDPDSELLAVLESALVSESVSRPADPRWRVGVALLAIALAMQLTHHFRDSLARQPLVGSLVTRAYDGMGMPLAPDWDLSHYSITNWAATAGESDGGIGNLRITAQIRNDGPRPQPYPNVQLELKDRWEAVIGSRILTSA